MRGEPGRSLPAESGIELQRVEPRLFGRLRMSSMLAVGGLLLLVAVALLAVGHWVLGPLLLAFSLPLFGLYLAAARHVPPSSVSRRAVAGVWRARDEVRLVGTSVQAWTRAGRRVLALERELRRLGRERDSLQHALGGAAYREDEAAAGELRGRIRELEKRTADCAGAIAEARREAEECVSRARAPLGRTEVVKPPR